MNNYMKTIISGLKQWVSSQKSDWNQNDSSATNFIKNRPFYSEEKEKVLFSSDSSSQEFILAQPLVKGNTYMVVFNGTTYQCLAKEYDGYIMIGNNAIYEYDGGIETDTGEPFAIEHEVNGTNAYLYYDDTITEAPSVSISGMVEEVHQIDSKYVPIPELANVAFSGNYYDLRNRTAVEYFYPQDLPESNKQLARNNIGAASKEEANSKLQYVAPKVVESPSSVHAIAYGNGKYVVAPSNYYVPYSTNGIEWNTTYIVNSQNLLNGSPHDVAFINNKFFMFSNRIITSEDGVNWSKAYDFLNGRDIIGKDQKILVYNATQYALSLDGGNTWATYSFPAGSWTIGCFANDTFYIYSNDNDNMIYSTDGINWTGPTALINGSGYIYNIIYEKDKFVCRSGSTVEYSQDGISWTQSFKMTSGYTTGLEFLNNKFYLFTYSSIYTSLDGVTWEKIQSSPGFIKVAAKGDNEIIGLDSSGNVYFYRNEQQWTKGTVAQSNENTTDVLANILYAPATTSTDGLMSAADKTKVNGIATNLVNGIASGSLRSVSAASEDASYSLGQRAFATGSSTKASGNNSHAEGLITTASGLGSHAEGANTTASGSYSHAEGYNTTASGSYSHTEGENTIAASKNQHVQGKNNVADSAQKYAHIVGNGESNIARSNAHTIDWNGNAWFAGSIYVGGTSQDDATAVKVAIVPFPTAADEGKILRVINGAPTWVALSSAEEASF